MLTNEILAGERTHRKDGVMIGGVFTPFDQRGHPLKNPEVGKLYFDSKKDALDWSSNVTYAHRVDRNSRGWYVEHLGVYDPTGAIASIPRN